uniref:Uncharacterized protein n=1 Tax=Parascaris univalens TaxID=6257 RepID=A0A915BHM4_PARUN
MKMEGVSEMVNGRNELQKQAQPSPKEIGREFVRQYYTMLSERPHDVFRFYSHESFFVHDIDQPVQGQQKIREAIERLEFVDCKARIYTVSGTATISNGLVIQVCGELSMNDQPGRRFLQTFVLCPQTPKKYYVHNDVFQWLDHAFVDLVPQTQQQGASGGAQNEIEEGAMANGGAPTVNGHQQVSAEAHLHQSSAPPEGTVEVEETKCESEAVNEQPEEQQHAEQDVHSEHETAIEKHDEHYTDETPLQPDEQAPELHRSPTVVDTAPKTWAKLVGGSGGSSTPASQPPARQPVSVVQQQNLLASAPTQHASASVPPSSVNIQQIHPSSENEIYGNTGGYGGSRFIGEDGCRLYIGGIMRNIIPDGTAVVEREIRNAFEKFGPVASVNVPRRVLDGPETQRNVYAFVVMKTLDGAKNAFGACRKDRGISFIPLKIDSFGFEGEAMLSEQKGGQGGPRGAPFRGGAPMQGMQRGGYGMRGGPGGGRGGGRGLHPRVYGAGGGGDYRHAGVAGAHP